MALSVHLELENFYSRQKKKKKKKKKLNCLKRFDSTKINPFL